MGLAEIRHGSRQLRPRSGRFYRAAKPVTRSARCWRAPASGREDDQIRQDALLFAERALIGEALVAASVGVHDGRISVLVPGRRLDGARPLPRRVVLAPGFVDLQVNGGGGVLFNDEPTLSAIGAIAAAHRAGGTTCLLPTLITDRPDRLARAADAVRAARRAPAHPVGGLHLEGPHLSPRRPGVHDPALIRPMDATDEAGLAALARDPAIGRLLLTVAPETLAPGTIARLVAAGAIVAAGHTEADGATVRRAVAEGLRGFTHLWNAMPPIASRVPGPVAAALLEDAAWCGLIADLVHVEAAALALTLRCKPRGRCVLVTDAMPPAGTAIAEFRLQGRRILRAGGRLATEDGTLAGADLTMIEAVDIARNRLGAPLADALLMASTWPADAAGLAGRGRIAPGAAADLLLVEEADDGRLALLDPSAGT